MSHTYPRSCSHTYGAPQLTWCRGVSSPRGWTYTRTAHSTCTDGMADSRSGHRWCTSVLPDQTVAASAPLVDAGSVDHVSRAAVARHIARSSHVNNTLLTR